MSVKVDNRERVRIADKLGGKLLPSLWRLSLVGVIETRPAAAGDDVNHAVWLGMSRSVESLVERELTFDENGVLDQLRNELHRKRTLIIVNVPIEDNINLVLLEDRREGSHVLILEMRP